VLYKFLRLYRIRLENYCEWLSWNSAQGTCDGFYYCHFSIVWKRRGKPPFTSVSLFSTEHINCKLNKNAIHCFKSQLHMPSLFVCMFADVILPPDISEIIIQLCKSCWLMKWNSFKYLISLFADFLVNMSQLRLNKSCMLWHVINVCWSVLHSAFFLSRDHTKEFCEIELY
jgi:hypothetical protein